MNLQRPPIDDAKMQFFIPPLESQYVGAPSSSLGASLLLNTAPHLQILAPGASFRTHIVSCSEVRQQQSR